MMICSNFTVKTQEKAIQMRLRATIMENRLSPTKLYQLLEKEEEFFLFDVRNSDAFEKWHIEGKTSIPTLNIPYFDLIEKGGKEDFQESIIHFIKTNLSEHLPKDKIIVVVCAKGETSAIIADLLKNLGYQATSLSGGMKNWGDFYERKTIIASPNLSIYQLIRVSRGCLSYVIVSNEMATIITPLKKIQFFFILIEE